MQERMTRRLPGSFRLGVVLAATLLVAGSTTAVSEDVVAADSSAASEDEAKARWQPALSLGFVLNHQNQQGANPTVAGCPSNQFAPRIPGCLGVGLVGSSDAMTSPGFRFDASIATPPLFESRFSPRLFTQVGVQILLEDSYIGYRSITDSDNPAPGAPPNETVETLLNSSIGSQWYLGAGFEFVIPAGDRDVRIRTAADYLGQSISGLATVDVTTRDSFGPTTLHYSSPKTEITNHALGASLQAEAYVYKWHSLRVSLFLETRFAWVLDPKSMTLVAVNTSDPTDVQSGTFTLVADSFIAQGGGGIRFSWLPNW